MDSPARYCIAQRFRYPAVPRWAARSLLAPLATVSLLQLALRRQKMPTWTLKAKILLGITILLTLTTTVQLALHTTGVIGLAFLANTAVAFPDCCLVLFLPIDRLLKKAHRSGSQLRDQFSNLLVIGVTGSVNNHQRIARPHSGAAFSAGDSPAREHRNGVAMWLLQTLLSSNVSIVVWRLWEWAPTKMGEIDAICRMTKPTMGIITRIGEEHLALSARAEYRAGQDRIIRKSACNRPCFFPATDNICRLSAQRAQATVHTIGSAKPADAIVEQATSDASGIHFVMDGTSYSIPIQGIHNVPNAALAISCARTLGQSPDDIAKRLQSFVLQQHTFNLRHEHDIDILDATYNASPQSFDAAIEWAAAQPHAQKYLITSGNIELGKEEAGLHEAIAKRASSVFAQAFITSNASCRISKPAASTIGRCSEKHEDQTAKTRCFVCISRMSDATIAKLCHESVFPYSSHVCTTCRQTSQADGRQNVVCSTAYVHGKSVRARRKQSEKSFMAML